ncbi:MAG TPA: ribonuclease P protein component [Candidatus Moranbacteria bacterium]|nr:ribonuclease P protein component [Candidatus Moranbacteria bacterium]
MLPQKNRLTERKDFEKVYKYGNFFCFENISLKYAKNGLDESRIGFSVGAKYFSKATERNRIKRQLRGFFKDNLKKIKKGMDIVVIVKKDKNSAEKPEKKREKMEKILQKANLIID